jgi:dephospho-CoA kinase
VLAEISETFGSDVLNPDGTLNRNRLGAIVFADSSARERLNRITHPPILRLLHAQIEAARTDLPADSLIAVEVPLLYETHLEDWFDCVLTVAASEPVQIARLMLRNGLSEENARQRIAAQMPLAEKVRRSHFVLWNDGSEAELKNNLKKFIFQ